MFFLPAVLGCASIVKFSKVCFPGGLGTHSSGAEREPAERSRLAASPSSPAACRPCGGLGTLGALIIPTIITIITSITMITYYYYYYVLFLLLLYSLLLLLLLLLSLSPGGAGRQACGCLPPPAKGIRSRHAKCRESSL